MTYLPMQDYEPDYDGMWAEIESLDDAAREAIERANGGPVFNMHASLDGGSPIDLDREAIMRVIGKITLGEADQDAFAVARTVNLRQAAGETPAEFVRRIALALLNEMAGV